MEPGQVVTAGQAAIRVARLYEKEAVIAVPEALVGRISAGKASVTLWSSPDRRYTATLRELSPVADAATRTYAARFALPAAGDAVKLGMTATLTVADGHQGRAARLPLSALFNQGTGPVRLDRRCRQRLARAEAGRGRRLRARGTFWCAAASRKAIRSWRWASRSSTARRKCASSPPLGL